MVLWIFGYGSLVWRAGFEYDRRMPGYIKGYQRLFHQGSTDHRGTPEAPGRTVTLEPLDGAITWGAAYSIEGGKDAESTAISYLEVREKEYDVRALVDFFSAESGDEPAVRGVVVYIASTERLRNPRYLGPAPLEDIARQIAVSRGPSGPNTEYLFQLEEALIKMGAEDEHVTTLSKCVRHYLGKNGYD